MHKTRCGECENCRLVESTKRLVLSECKPFGSGINQQTVDMWNRVLEDNPCERWREHDADNE